MQDNKDLNNQEIIKNHREIIELYIKYWEAHILPLSVRPLRAEPETAGCRCDIGCRSDNKPRQKAALETLLHVAERMYGMAVFSEICMRIFASGK